MSAPGAPWEPRPGPPSAPASPLAAACVALLPLSQLAQLPEGPLEESIWLDGWRVHEVERTATSARVSIARAGPDAPAAIARPHCVADLLWVSAPQGRGAGRGTWLLSHVDDPRQDLTWDVYCAPGGHTWRMVPRYSPAWLRERERQLMARLRGTLPLPDDPIPAATTGTPVWLAALHAVLHEQERDRATVAYHDRLPVDGEQQPRYIVKVRRRRLSLRPYRSLGFWLVDGVTRVRQAVER